jgi:hypothetical protein
MGTTYAAQQQKQQPQTQSLAASTKRQLQQLQHQVIVPANQSTTAPSLEIFTCVRRNVTLSTAGCGRMWRSANGATAPERFEGRYACRGCPIGESNFVGRAPDPYAVLRESVCGRCSRCFRSADRLIWPKILGFCISCYNRHREAILGRNAKGHPPEIMQLLHTEQAQVTTSNGVYILTRHHVLSYTELCRQAQRTATVPLFFVRWITLSGSATNSNSGVGTLGEVQPIVGTGVSTNEATAVATVVAATPTKRSRPPRVFPAALPDTSWVRPTDPVTSWMWAAR